MLKISLKYIHSFWDPTYIDIKARSANELIEKFVGSSNINRNVFFVKISR